MTPLQVVDSQRFIKMPFRIDKVPSLCSVSPIIRWAVAISGAKALLTASSRKIWGISCAAVKPLRILVLAH